MPLIVDRAEKRAAVIEIAFDLVADRGIEALTFREIAAAASCSTSIVSHYFGNKNELLFCVYQVANQRAAERIQSKLEDKAALSDCFETVLPLSDESRRNWRVWLAFWARAHIEPAYFEERRKAAEQSLALYASIIRPSLNTNDETALDLCARRLLAAIAGIGLEACFAPDDWSSDRIREVLRSELHSLGLGPPRPA
ncbi:MAG: hypothetical protein RIS94_2185 [Pseudomonadota bacterium]|jgi:AcrR family transcriptional regulator